MDSNWKKNFSDKIKQVHSQWAQQFETVIDEHISPVFDEFSEFVSSHDFKTSTPMQEPGRRSFKFEIAENAYLLMIFRTQGVGEFQLGVEVFAPGVEPQSAKQTERLSDVTKAWAREQFQDALDAFVTKLGAQQSVEAAEPVAV